MDSRLCTRCKKEINFDPYVKGVVSPTTGHIGQGDCYCGCWCGRWWCSNECARQDGYKFVGDSYEVDHISCNYCKKSGSQANQMAQQDIYTQRVSLTAQLRAMESQIEVIKEDLLALEKKCGRIGHKIEQGHHVCTICGYDSE